MSQSYNELWASRADMRERAERAERELAEAHATIHALTQDADKAVIAKAREWAAGIAQGEPLSPQAEGAVLAARELLCIVDGEDA